MIYPRLLLARDLLTEDGVIFLSIDDHEFDNLKKICDEVFGECNRCGTFIVNSTPNARDYGLVGKMHEFCLFYAKNRWKAKTYLLPDTEKKFRFADEKGGFNIHPLYNSNEAFHCETRTCIIRFTCIKRSRFPKRGFTGSGWKRSKKA